MRRRDLLALGAVAPLAGAAPATTTGEVRLHNGVPTLFLNGKPHCGMAYAAYLPSIPVFRDFTAAGVDLYSFVATPTEARVPRDQTAWVAPGKYDFSQLDERIAMVLEANPKAYFFPRLYLHAPKWWADAHPDDLVHAGRDDGSSVIFVESEYGQKRAPSWTSSSWRHDTIEGLKKLIAHVEASSYADRCVGYHLASGMTDEWMAWGSHDKEWVDYSPVNTAAFRQWLRTKYGSAAKFENAVIPNRVARRTTQLGTLRDPATEQAVIDFYQFNSDLVADTICTLAGAVKGITNRKKFVGVFYGYTLQLCAQERQQNSGHLAVEKVLACPDVDFLCSPASKTSLQLGGQGTSYFMSLSGSVALHGKMWFEENDIRTSLSSGAVGIMGKPENIAGDIIQQNKEMAHILTSGAAQWWFDVGKNRYDDPALMRRIKELTKTAGEVLDLDRSPIDEVAMVVDERSVGYIRPADSMGGWLLNRQLPALSRIGAPVGHYLATDLSRIADRKLFLFMTSFAPTAADRRAVDALKNSGRVLVFFYAPGVYREGKLDEAAMSDFTGIKLRMSKTPAELRAVVRPGHLLTDGAPGASIGIREKVSPVCYADDPNAVVLGTLADGRPAIVFKPQDGWTAVFSGVPMLPAWMLRRLAAMAKVHPYIETEDVVWASREMLALSVFQAGVRRIRLPHRADIRDLYSGAVVARATDSFEASFAQFETRVFVHKT